MESGGKKGEKRRNLHANLYEGKIQDVEIDPEIIDEVLHPATIGRGIIELDGVTLPLEPQHDAKGLTSDDNGIVHPGGNGLVERLNLGQLAHIRS
jgi:hypothetical protein